MSKEIELSPFRMSCFNNCLLLSEQDLDDGLTLNQLYYEIRNLAAKHGGTSRIHISNDDEYGMIITVRCENQDVFKTYALNPPRSSTTSE